MKMSSRARGQCTGKMLPRLTLLAILLAAGGLAAWAERPGRSLALGVGDGGDSAAVGDGCSGGNCANRSERSGNFGEPGEVDGEVEGGEGEGEEDEDEEDEGDGTAVEEGRGKKKKKGYGKMLMVLAGLTKAAMLYIMIHAVAALAGKALIVAKVALAIATAVALKKSSEHKTSYEIVKHPQYSHVQTHSSSVDYDHGSSGSGGYDGSSRRRRRRAFRR